MADSFHRAQLRQGARAWNDWRRANPLVVPDLDGLDLSLTERQLSPMHGDPINLARARLTGANLRHAALIAADLTESVLAEADLMNARLEKADLTRADLTGANLDDADAHAAIFDQAIVRRARLDRARNLTQAQLDAAVGDDETLLPSRLTRPKTWLVAGGSTAESAAPIVLAQDVGLEPPALERVLPPSLAARAAEPAAPRMAKTEGSDAHDHLRAASLPSDVADMARTGEAAPHPHPPLAASPIFDKPPAPAWRPPDEEIEGRSPPPFAEHAHHVGWLGYGVAGVAAGLFALTAVFWAFVMEPESPPAPRSAEAVAAPVLERGPTPAAPDRDTAAAEALAYVGVREEDRRGALAEAPAPRPAAITPPKPRIAHAPSATPESMVPVVGAPERGAIIPLEPKPLAETRSLASGDAVAHAGRVEPLLVAMVTETEAVVPPAPREIPTFEAPEAPSPEVDASGPTASIEPEQRPAAASAADLPDAPGLAARRKPAPRPPTAAPRKAPPKEASSAFANTGPSVLQQANDQFDASPLDGASAGDGAAPTKPAKRRLRARRAKAPAAVGYEP